ncbi:MAG: DNA-deoxyinosine glycosylase [Betaproteobacteria bacterium]
MPKPRVRSFAPIAHRRARVLILGSMPGRASLAAGQYYAHKQNAFWKIVCGLLDIDPQSPYRKRIQALRTARIAVWDVLQSCTRHGSLDSMIERDTEIANDFPAFFRRHREITHVFFNGAKAAASFDRNVRAALGTRTLRYSRLPSTSPAHASLSLARKRRAWRAILNT